MGAIARKVSTVVGVHSAPGVAPGAAIVFVGIERAVGVVAFDVGEVVEHLVVGDAVGANLIVARIQVASDAGPIEVPGHVHEGDIGVIRLELAHGGEIGVDPFFRVIADAAAPRPDDHVGLRMAVQIASSWRHPTGVPVFTQVIPILIDGECADAQGVHTADRLAAVGGMAVENVELGFRLVYPVLGNLVEVCRSVVNDNRLLRLAGSVRLQGVGDAGMTAHQQKGETSQRYASSDDEFLHFWLW